MAASFTSSPRNRLSAALLGGAVLLAGSTDPTRAQTIPSGCIDTAPVLTCMGNRSSGVVLNTAGFPSTYTTLNVLDLNSNIAPPSGGRGVSFTSDGEVIVNVSTPPFAIVTTGDVAPGIYGGTNGGNVTINALADITTDGDLSHGIAAESFGGAININAAGSIVTSGDAVGGLNGAFGIYASSAFGNIEINSALDIATSGIQGVGIFAETSGFATVFASGNIRTSGEGAAGIAVAGEAGVAMTVAGSIRTEDHEAPAITAISDGDVDVTWGGAIVTEGDDSRGIWAQSDNGKVTVIAAGTITTAGQDSDGIWATSDGDIEITSAGNIITTGPDADGISAASSFGAAKVTNYGNISATGLGAAGIYVFGATEASVENYGSVTGGACCAAVMMDSTSSVSLTNYGIITAGLADYAIDVMSPDNTVENYGIVTGDVRLFDGFPSGVGTFNNRPGALFNSGNQVWAAVVNNDGTIAPGGRGNVQITSMSDEFVQGPLGVYAVDIDSAAGTNDYIDVSVGLSWPVMLRFVC